MAVYCLSSTVFYKLQVFVFNGMLILKLFSTNHFKWKIKIILVTVKTSVHSDVYNLPWMIFIFLFCF